MRSQSRGEMCAYAVKPRYQKTLKKATKMYLRLQDKVAVMNECGEAALILYEFYISKAGTPNYSFSDKAAGNSLNWDLQKVQRNRLKLVKAKYFKQVSGKLSDGRKVVITYLDPELINSLPGSESDTEHLINELFNENEGHVSYESN